MQALLTVVVGAPSVAGQWPQGAALVIDAQPSRLAALTSGQRQNVDLVCEPAVLAEEGDQPVDWYFYNDSRLDGVVPVSRWQTLFPNAVQLEHQQLLGARLDTLLDRWAGGRDQPFSCPLVLILRQGDPLAALAGLGAWERLLQRVELVSPSAETLWGTAVASWLEAREFQKMSDQPLAWGRDLVVRCLRACEELTEERTELQLRVAELESRLTQINQEAEEALLSLDATDVSPAVEV